MEKKKKISGCYVEQNVDRISYLPDPIRSHIVSFLPMEEAIRTSILSKRWSNICYSLSNLDFCYSRYTERICLTQRQRPCNRVDFKDFVYQTLILHDGSDIQKFNLGVDPQRLSSTHIIAWISFALRHNVRKLDISSSNGEIEKLPYCLFSCRTLTKLTLFQVKLTYPEIIELPLLKTLRLVMVNFHDGIPPNQLISSCPVLENLIIIPGNYAIWNYQIVLTISSPSIKFLYLSFSKVPTHALKISTPNLKRLIYTGYPPEISLEILSSLYFVDLSLPILPTSSVITLDDLVFRATKILMGLHRVGHLNLGLLSMEYLSRVRDLSALRLTSWVNLKHLELDVCPKRHQLRATTFLLSRFPNLETLLIRVSYTFKDKRNRKCCWESQELATEGILKNLKTVNFIFFEGSEGELDLVRYLLTNANILEKMDINYFKQTKEVLVSMKEKIMAFSKVSPHAVISFSTYFH